MYDIKKIKQIINKYEYISFDIFNTLIKRNVFDPYEVFNIVQKEYKKKYNKDIKDFKTKRIKAEMDAKKLAVNEEPNIDDIYDKLEVESKEEANTLKMLEIETELCVCQQNIDFYEIYEYCVKNEKKIIITSDMYLKKDVIEKILLKANIKNYDYLFLSNDIKLNKHNGKIYPYILEKLKIATNQIVHIGDSKRGDFIFPRLYGIRSILIPKTLEKLKYYDIKNVEDNLKEEYNGIQVFINNNIDIKKDAYYKIGYETLGIMLYGYSKWLLSNLIDDNIKKIIFLSREGYLLKKAFDIINDSDIESKYIYISRRSVRPALLENIETYDNLLEIINLKETTDVQEFLNMVGLDLKYKKIFENYKYKLNTKIQNVKQMSDIFVEIKEDIKRNAQKERTLIEGYLKQNDLIGNCAISDIGWAGSMQESICLLFNNYNIKGFYIAIKNDTKKTIKKYGYLKDYEKIRPFVHLFEDLFLAPHGTTIKYKRNKDGYEEILDQYEFSENEKEKIQRVQEGALQFIKDFISSKDYKYFQVSNEISEVGIMQLGLNPTNKDIKLFEDIPYIETVKKNMIEARSLIYYIFNIKELKKDIINSGWKIGFLKKLLKLNMPYFKIYKYLLNLKEKK